MIVQHEGRLYHLLTQYSFQAICRCLKNPGSGDNSFMQAVELRKNCDEMWVQALIATFWEDQ